MEIKELEGLARTVYDTHLSFLEVCEQHNDVNNELNDLLVGISKPVSTERAHAKLISLKDKLSKMENLLDSFTEQFQELMTSSNKINWEKGVSIILNGDAPAVYIIPRNNYWIIIVAKKSSDDIIKWVEMRHKTTDPLRGVYGKWMNYPIPEAINI